ncbi:PstS family phosphate ABC transporter substrate-binding protein [bacterium]|nr:PstS family phosphate ABC transporter substrate-binding protein [bacterium]
MNRRWPFLLVTGLLFSSACHSANAQNTGLLGKVSVDGSSTVYPISEAAASGFQKQYPKVKVSVGVSGTGGGFKRFTVGDTDISDASRPIKASEFAAAQKAGIEFYELPVAYDGLTMVTRKSNTWLNELTIQEIKQIFLADSAAKVWSDIRKGWPAEEIKIFAPGTDSGTFDYFKEVVVGKSGGSLRSDMSTSEDDNVLVTGVSGTPNAIGFFGVAYYEENKDKLKSVAIVNPKTGKTVSPTASTIENGTYAPFSRPLFIYVNAASFKRPEVRKFIGYYLKNAAELASKTGYVALPASIYKEAMMRCRLVKPGTHYLTRQLEKRSGPVTEIYQAANLLK